MNDEVMQVADATSSTTIHELGMLGHSVWLDSISRDWLDSGELDRMIDAFGLRGLTSNPSIFAAALNGSDAYDADIRELVAAGLTDREIFARLATDDIRRACDALAGVHERSGGVDGMVSIEVEPDLAHDGETTAARARELWEMVGRPNLMIKVPATIAGLPAIEELLFDSVNVNVTLLFSVSMYEQVLDRYLRAIERRIDARRDPVVHSVASFFVSRVDTKVDALLSDVGEAGAALRGRIAVANAIAAYDAADRVFSSTRFESLERAGALRQRPLWASTGTKNPAYSDILYVQPLIAAGTVNTMPLATIEAFVDHGAPEVTIRDTSVALAELGQLASLGIDLGSVTDQLLDEGVESFAAAYRDLIALIAGKRP